MDPVRARIHKSWYDIEGRKYLDLEIDGRIIQVKIPFRYNRVMCRVLGIKPIQEFTRDQIIDAFIERKMWSGTEYWILRSVREIEA